MSAAKLLAVVALLLSVLAGIEPGPAVAADPFYTRLLERGVRDLELGLAPEAQQRLRTACFGFLDEPLLLAEALMQLGRAQAQTRSTADLIETAERLVEIEDRFKAYSSSDDALRAAFEGSLRSALPEARLERMKLFSHLTPATEAAVETIQPLTPKQRRKALEQQIAANPGDGEALLELARLHSENGKLKAASGLLDELLATQPGQKQALCLRADIAIDRKECAPALAGLDLCAALIATDRAAAFVLDCLTSAQRPGDAMALLEKLPPERRAAPVIARAARELPEPEEGSPAPAEESATVEPSATQPPPVVARAPRELPEPEEGSPAPAEGSSPVEPSATQSSPVVARAARELPEPEEGSPAPAEESATVAPSATQSVVVLPENGSAQPPNPKPAEQQDVAFPPVRIGLTLEERMRRLREEVSQSRFREQLEEAMRLAVELADSHPDSAEAQHLAAEIAYLASDWQSVVDYFDRGGRPSAERPELLFYLAVATYELGDAEEAGRLLEKALPTLPRNSFIDEYVDRILPPPES